MTTHRSTWTRIGLLTLALAVIGFTPLLSSGQIQLDSCAAPGVDTDALCGHLTVWEDREAKSGRQIELSVMVLPASGEQTRADPIFALHGGPGAAARFLAPAFANNPVRITRDIVLVDQRGTGGSNAIHCEPTDPAALIDAVLSFSLMAVQCADFEANPALYTTSIAMEDLDEVRDALGYDRINLWGGSYGTRASLDYMRRHPERVRTALLDGVAPPTLYVPLHFASGAQAALDLVLEDCKNNSGCSEAFGDVAEKLEQTLARLAASPEHITVNVPGLATPIEYEFGRQAMSGAILYALYNAGTAAQLPAAISAAHAESYTPMGTIGAAFALGVASQFSFGMTLSVICAEDIPNYTREEAAHLARHSFLGPKYSSTVHDTCSEWPRGEIPDGFNEHVVSDVPTLLLSGQGDPVTPPQWAEAASQHLNNSHHIIFPDMGHGQTFSPCGTQLWQWLLDTEGDTTVDRACLEEVGRPPFAGAQ